MKKKVVALMLGAVMVLSLAACSNSSNNGGDTGADNAGSSQETAAPASDDGSGEAQTGTDTAAASGEVYDTTAFSVTVPDGWAAADYPDSLDLYDGDVDPTQLYVIKDGKSADDILVCPYIMFTYVDDTEYWDLDVSDLYEDYEEIESIEIGGKEYSGYKYTSLGYPGVYLHRDEGEGYMAVTIVLENSDGTIALEDDDVQSIIASFTVD